MVDPYAVPEGGGGGRGRGRRGAGGRRAAPAGDEPGADGEAAGGEGGDETLKLGNRIEAPKRGSIVRISEVTEQLRVIGLTLARKLPRREREEFERMKRALIEERADLEAKMRRSAYLSLGEGIRVYDATKRSSRASRG